MTALSEDKKEKYNSITGPVVVCSYNRALVITVCASLETANDSEVFNAAVEKRPADFKHGVCEHFSPQKEGKKLRHCAKIMTNLYPSLFEKLPGFKKWLEK